MTELKPCPFCGGEGSLNGKQSGRAMLFWCNCTNCEASTCVGFSQSPAQDEAAREEAIENWNRRNY